MNIERKSMGEVQQSMDLIKKEFKDFIGSKIQEALSLNNNCMLPDDKLKPLSVSIYLYVGEPNLCWLIKAM